MAKKRISDIFELQNSPFRSTNDNMAPTQNGRRPDLKETIMFRYFLFFLLMAMPVAGAGLEVGDSAPPFSLPGSDGQNYTLEQFLGKKPVVLAWYPKAFTGG
jgi:hypothetical protein